MIIDQVAQTSSYVSGGPNAVSLKLVGQDRFGDTEKTTIQIAQYTTARNVNNVEVTDKGVALMKEVTPGFISGGVFWAQASTGGPAGSFDIKFQSISFRPAAIATDLVYPATFSSGSTITLAAGIANYSEMTYEWTSGTNPVLVIGYATRAAGAATQDVFYQAFNETGQAIGPRVQGASGMRADGAFTVLANGLNFFLLQENNSGAAAVVEVKNFAPATGAITTSHSITTNLEKISNVSAFIQSDGNFDIIVDGMMAGGQHAFSIYQANGSLQVSGVPTTITLSQAGDARQSIQRMANDYIVVAYTDANQVHLAVIHPNGSIIENTIVPDITNFDRIRSLGQNQFELLWRETVQGAENVVKGAIYDLNQTARIVDQSASGNVQWLLGSQFADTLKGGTANDIFKGYQGNDSIDGGGGRNEVEYTGARSDYTVTRNGDGTTTVVDNRVDSPDGTDTLRNIQVLDFTDRRYEVATPVGVKLFDLGPLFSTAAGPVTGQNWSRPHRTQFSGDVLVIDNRTPASGFVAGGPNPQTLVVTGQDRFGDLEKYAVTVATYTSARTVNNAEVTDKFAALFSQQGNGVAGAAVWAEKTSGGIDGTFDLKFQKLVFNSNVIANNGGTASTTLVGAPIIVAAAIADYAFLDWDFNGTTLFVGYVTRAAGATTQKYYYQAYDFNGIPAGPRTMVGELSTSAAANIVAFQGTGSDSFAHFMAEDNSQALAKIKISQIAASTGAITQGASIATNVTDIRSMVQIILSDGTYMIAAEGTETGTGAHIIEVFHTDGLLFMPDAPSTKITLVDAAPLQRFQIQRLPNNTTIIAYTDNNQVHLTAIDPFGNITGDTIVAGLTTFDRIRSMGTNQLEVMWRETVSGNENVVKGAVYDFNAVPRFVDQSASSSTQWLPGSQFADTLRGGSANDIFKGYSGNDIIAGGAGIDSADYTGTRSNYTVTQNNDGSWTITDNRGGSPDGTDTLTGVEFAQFSDQTIALSAPPPPLGASPVTKLADLGALFGTTSGPISGQVWSRPHRMAFNGDVVVIDAYTSVAGFVNGGPNPQTLVVSGQTRFGETEKYTVTIANYVSGRRADNNSEVTDKFVVLFNQPSSASYTIAGAAAWLEPTAGAAAGTFSVKFQGLTFSPGRIAYDSTTPSVQLSGVQKTLGSPIANYAGNLDWDFSSTTLLVGYRTFTPGGTTRDQYYQGFDTTGTAIGPLTKVATVSPGATSNIYANAFEGPASSQFTLFVENNSATNATLDVSAFTPSTGVVGPALKIATGLTDFLNVLFVRLADGGYTMAIEGRQAATGQHVFEIIRTSSSFVVQGGGTIAISDTAQISKVQIQRLTNESSVLAYVDAGQVHLTMINASGVVTSDYVVPGLTSFERLRSLSQNQFELIWLETVAGVENVVKGAVYDANTAGRISDVSGASVGQWLAGTPFADTLTGSAQNDIFKGYGGADTFNGGAGVNEAKFTGNKADYTIVENDNGTLTESDDYWTVTDNRVGSPDGVDTLRNVQALDFADQLQVLGVSGAQADQGVGGLGFTGAGNVLNNDGGFTANSLTVHKVNGSTANVGATIVGAYGTLVLKANGAFEYKATNPTGATGSHLHDIFTYSAIDAAVAAVFGEARATTATRNLDIEVNRDPTVSVANYSASKGTTSIAWSSLFSAADADGDAIRMYQFYDGTAAATSGSIKIGGVSQAAMSIINVNAADLASATFSFQSTSDLLWVRVFDEVGQSEWKSFTAAPFVNTAPVAVAPLFNPTHTQTSVAASSLFSVTDIDNDTITQYEFWDSTTAPESGSWRINGVAQGTNQAIAVSAANLANTTFTGGTVSDLLYVRAFDGLAWSSWTAFNANAIPNAVPVAVAPLFTPAHGQTSVSASSLFSVSDADNDTITKYQFWDSTTAAESGSWRINGVAQGTNQAIEVSAANLATASFSVGTVLDQVFVRAFDGLAWSSWAAFTVNPAPNAVPVAVAPMFTPAHGQTSVAASSLFSVSDADNDTITKYEFWDSTTAAESGSWRINGVAQGTNQAIAVTAANLATASFSIGTVSDQVFVRAFDGLAWSSWTPFTVNPAPNAIPVAVAPLFSPTHAQTSVAASSLFSVSDADNDTITKYEFWDSTTAAESGSWRINGVAQGTNQAIAVSAANLANTTFNGGTVADLLYVRAFDGLAWSGWTAFNANPIPNAAPVAVTPLFTPAHGQTSVSASSLFSVSDADNDTITKYEFWDSTTAAESGSWRINGVAQGTNQAIAVTAANLATASFSVGTVLDQVFVRAFDGLAWSNWSAFTVNPAPNAIPVAVAPLFSPTHTQTSVAASSLFSVSDADNDTITKYQFWDSTTAAESGSWRINGVAQGTNQAIEVSAANLANTTFTGGTVSDLLYVRAFDGLAWSSWTAFNANPIPNAAPVAVAPLFSPTHAQTSVAASSLFSVSDADNDTITKYQFWDSTTAAESGSWRINGVAQGTNQAIEVSAANLANTTFTGGTVADLLYVRAFDGLAWSNWTAFNANPIPNAAPVTTPTANVINASHGQTLAASSLFSVSDADNDTITKYQFWDSTTAPESGSWRINGVAQGTNQAIEVSAANLANTAFKSGSGSDLLYARAFDGLIWGDWKAFTVTAPIDAAPVVSASPVSLSLNQSVSAASLFSVTDAEGDAITAYQLWDGNPNPTSGKWLVNTIAQPSNQAIDVLAADLAQASFVAASVATTDLLYARAFDGYLWSAWKSFDAVSHV